MSQNQSYKNLNTRGSRVKNNILTSLFLGITISIISGNAALSAESNEFLVKQKDFNRLVYGVYSENVHIAQRGGFSRANFAVLDTTLSDEQQIAALIEKNIVPAAQVVCHRDQPLKCAVAIVNKDIRVLPTIKLANVLQFAEELKLWKLSEKWVDQLTQIQLAIKENLGNDFVEYIVGYNDDVELFNYVLISKDRTRAIVLNGELTVK